MTVKGRFAPSPTGRMHLGNVFAALLSWLAAKSEGGKWLLRIEDLDPQRSRRDYALLIEDDLRWLGLHWDEGGLDAEGPAAPYAQSLRSDIYTRRLSLLHATGLTYPCRCTRADLRATQAPHAADGRVIYTGRCRPDDIVPLPPDAFREAAVRLRVPDGEMTFTDLLFGPQSGNLAAECGDFVLRRADGAWAYQLAVVADDIDMGVTQVTRGADLLPSTFQQLYLYRLFSAAPPTYLHIPLLCNDAGQRLSKRDGSLSLDALRSRCAPTEIIGALAAAAGLRPDATPCTAASLLADFSPRRLPAVATLRSPLL